MTLWNLIESIPCPSFGIGTFLTMYVGSFIIGAIVLTQPCYRLPRVKRRKG